jgi:hypothetical protein
LQQDYQAMMTALTAHGLLGLVVNQSGGALPEFLPLVGMGPVTTGGPASLAALLAVVPGGAIGPLVALAAAAPAAAVLAGAAAPGAPDVVGPGVLDMGGALGDRLDMGALSAAVEAVQRELADQRHAQGSSSSRHGRNKSDKKEKHRSSGRHRSGSSSSRGGRSRNKKEDRKKKKKKDSKGHGSSSHHRRSRSSRSGSSSSRSRRSGSSSDTSWMRWRAKGRDHTVDPYQIRRLEQVKFKARGDLMSFAAKHPGALSGYFLAMAHQKVSNGRVMRTKDLRNTSVSAWAQMQEVGETRDKREVATLAWVMDLINLKDLEVAMDVLSQRILAIQRAKAKGGSWEKGEMIELTPGGGGCMAAGLLKLTQ